MMKGMMKGKDPWGMTKGTSKGWGGGGSSGWGNDDPLVQEVKNIQKSGDSEKRKWWDFCSKRGVDKFDPARHSSEFLQAFLNEYKFGAGAGGSFAVVDDDDGTVVRLRGLPFSATAAEVVTFCSGYGIDESQVAVNYGADGRPAGEAFVVFSDKATASRAKEELQKAQMGSRYIELFSATYAEWTRASEAAIAHASGGGMPRGRRDESTGDQYMDNLIAQVKSIQRTGDAAKQCWYKYCDSSGDTNYDPKRHGPEFLQHFVDSYNNGLL